MTRDAPARADLTDHPAEAIFRPDPDAFAEIKGNPVSLGRPVFNVAQRRAVTPQTSRDAKDRLKWSYIKQRKLKNLHERIDEGPVMVHIDFVFKAPKKTRHVSGGWRACKPDIDNLGKLVLDALTGIAWIDDDQIVILSLTKTYGDEGMTRIRVWPAYSRKGGAH